MSDLREAAPITESAAEFAPAPVIDGPNDAETRGLASGDYHCDVDTTDQDPGELSDGPVAEAVDTDDRVTEYGAESGVPAVQQQHADRAGDVPARVGSLLVAEQATAGQSDVEMSSSRLIPEQPDGREQPPEAAGDVVGYDPEDLTHLHSGMQLANTSVREGLSTLLVAADTAYFASSGRPEMVERANDIATKVGDIDGVEVVRPGDFGQDQDNDCSHYTFGEVKGEPWAAPYTRTPRELWETTRSSTSPQAFLQQHGYGIIDGTPVPGDVVAYTANTAQEVQAGGAGFRHFGVLQSDGRVESKFAQGPVVRHWIDHVPSFWGSAAYFLRKLEIDMTNE